MAMKKNIIIVSVIISTVIASVMMNGCASTKLLDKVGAELWGENCVRCHSTPPPNAYTKEQWETVTMHMHIRASLTEDETKKIKEFLQSATN